jgi:hypothetical protein
MCRNAVPHDSKEATAIQGTVDSSSKIRVTRSPVYREKKWGGRQK